MSTTTTKQERKPRQAKGANLAPIVPPVPPTNNLPAIVAGSEMVGIDTGAIHGPKPLTRAERFPNLSRMLAGFYAGLVPGLGDGITKDSTTAEVFRFLELAHADVQVSAQKMLPLITYTVVKEGRPVRVFDSVDIVHGEGYGDYLHRVNRRAANIARRDTTENNQAFVLSSFSSLENKVWELAEKHGKDNPSAIAPLAFGDRSVLLAVRRDSAFVTAADGSQYRLAQVLNLPAKDTPKVERVKVTDSEKLSLYRGEVLEIAKKLSFLLRTAEEGDNPLAFLLSDKTVASIDKYNRFFGRLYKRLYTADDILSLAERMNSGEVITSL